MGVPAPFSERTIRRLRVYSGRLARTGPGPASRHPSVFIHMPKCGGTSLSEAMYATVPIMRRVAVIDAVSTRRAAAIWHEGVDDAKLYHEDLPKAPALFEFREQLLLQHMAWGSWLIHGHVLYSERARKHFGSAYKYVTLLRDPVARMISNYRMAARAGVVEQDFDAYLESPAALSHARVYLRYLGGRTIIPEGEESSALALSLLRLHSFDCVGFLDDLAQFKAAYRALFGVSLSIRTANKGAGAAPTLTKTQRQKVETLCAPDIALFEAARSAFRSRA
ncbi:MAG: hypothetical protein AAFY59_09820 [Pseudomonadota bacterium]